MKHLRTGQQLKGGVKFFTPFFKRKDTSLNLRDLHCSQMQFISLSCNIILSLLLDILMV